MNILFLTASLGLGGAEKQLVVWTDILQRDFGARVSVASFDPARTQRLPALEELGVRAMIVGMDRGRLGRIERIISLARSNRANIVHAFNYYLSPYAMMTAAAVKAVPVSSFQGDGVSDLQGLNPFLRSLTLRRGKYFTSNSHEAILRLRPQISAKAFLQYVPNLVEPLDGEASGSVPADRRRGLMVLAVGRLDDNKRLDIFLEALAAARKVEPQLTGMIAGDGPARDTLWTRAASLGLLPEGVRFLGQVLNMAETYASADIFVHLAISEGTPNVVLEAMAAGLPVVATGAGDTCRIIRPMLNGCLVPFDDAQSVSERLVELARSPDLRARLGKQGRTDVARLFSLEEVRDSLERFYSAVVPSVHSAARA